MGKHNNNPDNSYYLSLQLVLPGLFVCSLLAMLLSPDLPAAEAETETGSSLLKASP